MSQTQTEVQPSSEVQPGETTQTAGTEVPSTIESAPVVSEPKGLRGAGLRYTETDGVPEWAVGKTADELLEITKTLHSTMNAYTPAPAQPAAQPVAPATPSAPALSGDLMYQDPNAFVQGVQDYTTSTVDARIAAASEPLLAPLASMARNQAKADPKYEMVWSKYGPEIDAVMQGVPLQNRTDSSLWEQASQIVAGKHYRELASAEAERLVASGDSGMIPTGGVASTPASASLSPIDALFAKNDPAVEHFIEAGISPATVKEQAARMQHTEEKYAEMLTSNTNIRVG